MSIYGAVLGELPECDHDHQPIICQGLECVGLTCTSPVQIHNVVPRYRGNCTFTFKHLLVISQIVEWKADIVCS